MAELNVCIERFCFGVGQSAFREGFLLVSETWMQVFASKSTEAIGASTSG